MKNLTILSAIIILFTTACETEDPTKTNTNPDVPILTAPADLLDNVSPEDITLSWTCADMDGDTLTYSIYLGGSTPPELWESEISSTSLFINTLEPETSYYWQVEANDGNEGISTSTIFSFTTGKVNDPDAVPENPYPSDGLTGVSTPVTFTWECSNNAVTGYEVYMSDDPENISSFMVSAPALPTFTSSDFLANTTYYWFVVGRTKKEQIAFVSNTWSFTTK